MESSRIAQSMGQMLDRFINDHHTHTTHENEDFSAIMRAIVLASKIVGREINKAGLIDIMGASGRQNVSGDKQQKLDILAHIRFSRALSKGGRICALLSEEVESYETLTNEGGYIAIIDPLDGSSNIDVNVPVGTIFSIYRRVTPKGQPVQKEDLLQKGTHQIVAGYVLYGSSTMLVYTSGHGVNGFTYDLSLGEFILSHPDIKMPNEGTIYSINEGHGESFHEEVENYLHYCKASSYTARYVGSLVSDFHRNLLKGGIYMYPATQKNPKGKLRLLYECNALAWIAEQAGGKASDGKQSVLDIEPINAHQQIPFYIGSSSMVDRATNPEG